MSRRALAITIATVSGAVLLIFLFVALPRIIGRRPAPTSAMAAAAPAAPAPAGRKIKAHLYYVADDGLRLAGVERDVAYGDGPLEQAREIVAAQLAPVTSPLVSPIPAGTALRALFLTERGEAFVDLSRAVVTAHPGGTTNELLTVYAIVNALTANLPAITSVQVLVDGKEVETLAGHVDLRRPLTKNLAFVQ
jgi:spore germination protein GerM